MNKAAIFLLLSLTILFYQPIFPQNNYSLHITEIMFYAETGNNEFIEIFNSSETESMDLAGFQIKYYTSKPDLITDAGYGTMLPPKCFAVVFEGDYDFAGGIYNNLIPGSSLILKISDNAFGTSGMANSTSRAVNLSDKSGIIIDSCIYSADNRENISDEKIIPESENTPENWNNSIYIFGTPGFRNSVTPCNYDLEVKSVKIIPSKVLMGNSAKIEIIIGNQGLLNSGEFGLKVYDQIKDGSLNIPVQLLYDRQLAVLVPEDTATVVTNFIPSLVGIHRIFAIIDFEPDENTRNDSLSSLFNVYREENKYNDIVINEIMYAPDGGESEWVELFNASGRKVNLKNWTVADNSTVIRLVNYDLILEGDSYLIAAKDTAVQMKKEINNFLLCKNLPSLNNSGDAVVLKDSIGTIIDSVLYMPAWGGGSGKSLERKEYYLNSNDPAAWGTSLSLNNSTPGKINSISKKENDIAVSKILINPEMPIIGEDVAISALIKNVGKNPADFEIEIFEDSNHDSIFEKHVFIPGKYSVQSKDSIIVALNYLIKNIDCKKSITVKANFLNDQDTLNNYFSTVISPGYNASSILINEVMLNPSGGEPEWIEIFNTTDKDIDLSGWSVNDILTKPYTVKLQGEPIIRSGEFLILAADSSIYSCHKTIPCSVYILNIPLLNNDEDGIVLKDGPGSTIDSMFYICKNYKLSKGYSLERQSLKGSSLLTDNWGSSKDIEQSSPGRVNSISAKKFDLLLGNIYTKPQYPVAGDNVFVFAKIFNAGESEAENYKVNFYIRVAGAANIDTFLGDKEGEKIYPGDSLIISCPMPLRDLKDEIYLQCKIIYLQDSDTSNNYLSAVLKMGYPKGIIKINEIMYAPQSGEPEWIELYNSSETDSVNLKELEYFGSSPRDKKNCSLGYCVDHCSR